VRNLSAQVRGKVFDLHNTQIRTMTTTHSHGPRFTLFFPYNQYERDLCELELPDFKPDFFVSKITGHSKPLRLQ
jgi:hypothetical protein